MSKQVKFMMGLPASGKSTLSSKILLSDDRAVRVNKDNIRELFEKKSNSINHLFNSAEKKDILNREAFYIKNNDCVNESIPGEHADEEWIEKKRNGDHELSIKRLIHRIHILNKKIKKRTGTEIDIDLYEKCFIMLEDLM